LPRPM